MSQREAIEKCTNFYFGLVRYRKNSDANKVRSSMALIAFQENGDIKNQIRKLKVSMNCVEMKPVGLIPVVEKEFTSFLDEFKQKDIGFCLAIQG